MLMVFLVLACTFVTYLTLGYQAGMSAFWGGLAATIPNCVFAYKAFKYAGAQASRKVVESFYSGVKLKLGLTAFFVALALKFLVIVPLPFFGALSLVVVVPLLTPIFFKNFKF